MLPFVRFYGYLVYFSRFGMLCQEKSGNPDQHFVESVIQQQIKSLSTFLILLFEAEILRRR
jgi:hypothetical protein